MNGKCFARLSISLTLVLLLLVGALQVAIDPLFQYHYPWFGLEPVVTDERYQNAGVAKNFEYENVIIGNSLSENFVVSDVEKVFGGKTVKLTASGSHTADWKYLLDILKNKNPSNILFNLDPYIMDTDAENMKHELPVYLYDSNYVNDVDYLFNFEILNQFTFQMVKKNRSNKVPDYNKVFVWNEDKVTSRENALAHYSRPEKGENPIQMAELKNTALANMDNLTSYYSEMPDTQFVFFCSPFSILYWDGANQRNGLNAWRETYLAVIGQLVEHDNVSVYFWNDPEMLDLICDLDYYTDEAHYNVDVCKLICERISNNEGLMNQNNYKDAVNQFFDYLDSYDYAALFT